MVSLFLLSLLRTCEPCGEVDVYGSMDTTFLNAKFERIGARLKILHRPGRRSRTQGVLSLDIGTDRLGEYFEIAPQVDASPSIEVIDLQPANRHLLLLVREEKAKNKYLCGHDERHWFVAGIPEKASVGTVRQAMEALQRKEVQLAVAQNSLSGRVRNRRKNEAFVRQGEMNTESESVAMRNVAFLD